MSRLLDQVDFVKDIHADKPKATPPVGRVHLPYHPYWKYSLCFNSIYHRISIG